MNRSSWMGWAVLAVGAVLGVAACESGSGSGSGGGGGSGSGGAGGGTGTTTTTAVCPLGSPACDDCRAMSCADKCTSATCQANFKTLQKCFCDEVAAGKTGATCVQMFEFGDDEATAYGSCLRVDCGTDTTCDY